MYSVWFTHPPQIVISLPKKTYPKKLPGVRTPQSVAQIAIGSSARVERQDTKRWKLALMASVVHEIPMKHWDSYGDSYENWNSYWGFPMKHWDSYGDSYENWNSYWGFPMKHCKEWDDHEMFTMIFCRSSHRIIPVTRPMILGCCWDMTYCKLDFHGEIYSWDVLRDMWLECIEIIENILRRIGSIGCMDSGAFCGRELVKGTVFSPWDTTRSARSMCSPIALILHTHGLCSQTVFFLQ